MRKVCIVYIHPLPGNAHATDRGFLFLLTSMGTPLLPADFRAETMDFHQNQENSRQLTIDNGVQRLLEFKCL